MELTELQRIRRQARPLSDAARRRAYDESPFTKELIATRRRGGALWQLRRSTGREADASMHGQLFVYLLATREHTHPRFVGHFHARSIEPRARGARQL